MTLRLPDHWMWDSWFVDDGADHHVFFLRASRALVDPHRRHLRAAVGHAVSGDLRTWTLLPDALVHSDSPAWDDLAIWTGSVVRGRDGQWHLFYTGISRAHGAKLQRVGRAVSDDLLTWHRAHDGPVSVADPEWYETRQADGSGIDTWRDPWVFADPAGDGWHMLVTARGNDGDPAGRGVIGHARSADLVEWTAGPPLSRPAGFVDLEVPQVAEVDGHLVLVFSCLPGDVARRHDARPLGSVWVVDAPSVVGPFDVDRAIPFAHPDLYAGRVVADGDGGCSLLGFHNGEDRDDREFGGELSDPIAVGYRPDAGLLVRP